MVIGVLQVELLIGDATSLKAKRSVVKSIKDRIGRDPGIAVAEVDRLEAHQIAVLGIIAVSNSSTHVDSVLSRVLDRLRRDRRAVLNDQQMEILTGH